MRILAPAAWLAGRMRFRGKLLATFVLFAIPLAILTTLVLRDAAVAIERIEEQRRGLAYQVPLLQLIRSVQDHYAASVASIHGNSAMVPRAMAARVAFERGAPAVLQDPLAGELGLEALHRWEVLTASREVDAETSRANHEALLEGLSQLREHVVDVSGLELNDRVATQTLIVLLDRQLAPLIENLGRARDLGVGGLARGRISGSQREVLGIIRGSFDPLLAWMRRGVDKDAVLREVLAPPLDDLDRATIQVQEYLTTKLINAAALDAAPEDLYARGDAALDAANVFAARLVAAIDALLAKRAAEAEIVLRWTVAAFAVGIAVIAYLFAGAYVSILRSVRALGAAADAMAGGELRARVEVSTRDEIGLVGGAFNAMSESFSALIGKVIAAAGDTQRAAHDLTDRLGEVTSASAQQSETAADSSAAVEELAVSVQQVAAHAADTCRIVAQAAELSVDGREIADRAGAALERIVADTGAAVTAVLSLEERSRNVEQIVGVIHEIAQQTNLLALNAAIEAARAGEVGRGFAVVADEVRKLADRTGTATREIEGTLLEMREGIQSVVAGIREGSDRVGASSAVFGSVVSALDSIRGEVTRSATLVGEIVAATQAQTAASQEIARSIECISAMAEANHGTVRQTGGAIEKLVSLSGELRLAVAGLKV